MNLKAHIRNWLGVNDILIVLGRIIAKTEIHNRALGRIIAKFDPMYGVDELDPAAVGIMSGPEKEAYDKRINESARLCAAIIAKLKAEYNVGCRP